MKTTLRQICEIVSDKLSVNELINANLTSTYISTENMLTNKGGVVASSSVPTTGKVTAYKTGDVLVSNIRPYFKKIWFASNDGGCSNDVLVFRAKKDISPEYLHYVLADDSFFDYAMKTSKGTKMPRGDKKALMEYGIVEMDYSSQCQAAAILKRIDELIKTNTKINENLEQQAQAIFKSWFVDTQNEDRKTIRADEFFDISIGKTPPRKEHKWFTNSPDNVVWVSISDMGNCGLFIEDSSEYLTIEAIEKFNIKVVPTNTVILSFKLTIGRVAITTTTLTTNEAIAHFKTERKNINEYLFCYLKQFNFQSLGSTSSIATAVNSKIIKGMPFVLPTDDEITKFHNLVCPMFTEVLNNQREIYRLAALRDTLLPKLMNGEIDVSQVQL